MEKLSKLGSRSVNEQAGPTDFGLRQMAVLLSAAQVPLQLKLVQMMELPDI
jgi:hypothetical protein